MGRPARANCGMKPALHVSAFGLFFAEFRFALQCRQLRPGIDTLPASIANAPLLSISDKEEIYR